MVVRRGWLGWVLPIALLLGFAAVGLDARQLSAPPVPGAAPLATFEAAWQAIRETYVDDARSDADWERLHQEFRARAAAASGDDELRPVLRDLLSALGRSHFALVPAGVHERMTAAAAEPEEAGDVGLEITVVAGEALVTRVDPDGAGHRAGIRPGWVIEAVDGSDFDDLAGATAGHVDPQQAFRRWATAVSLLRGAVDSTVQLQVRDAGDRTVSMTLPRTRQAGHPVRFGHLPMFFARVREHQLPLPDGRRAAYIHFNIWMTPVAAAIDRAIVAAAPADGMVLDLRQNPGGLLTMLMGVSGHFLEQPLSLGTVRMRDSELKVVANPRFVAADGSPTRPYQGRLAILVDTSSYSASEIFAGGMQAIGRARVFGSQSPGGALPAMLRRLPNGDILEHAIGDFVTARGDRIEGRGVIPDTIVPLTRDAVLAGADPPLDAALAWLAGASDDDGRLDRSGTAAAVAR